ncbi:uncharacterized protein K489DRAFT_51502 [Dissoconium aciculare CBS 342.82]|uniref:Uncharacterized protein n=1 Tax=Dissoconium aciculare CBS 342.82 TaxID=1314786 RepID=A0A6J3M042_9PEZI|nr:uncharacterized protein K489DRAFT_51502 [Dissoconium aciculare CBS 342.82]KAF1820257.1 hypothetical protein K489DRAFT_51502 [Dissoconium aciculare CBS 342.82]
MVVLNFAIFTRACLTHSSARASVVDGWLSDSIGITVIRSRSRQSDCIENLHNSNPTSQAFLNQNQRKRSASCSITLFSKCSSPNASRVIIIPVPNIRRSSRRRPDPTAPSSSPSSSPVDLGL